MSFSTTNSSGIRQVTIPANDPTGTVSSDVADQILKLHANGDLTQNAPNVPSTVYNVAPRAVNVLSPDSNVLPSGPAVVDTSAVAPGNTPMFAALDWVKQNPLAAGAIAVGAVLLIVELTKKKKR